MQTIIQQPLIRVGSIVIFLVVLVGLVNEVNRYLGVRSEMDSLERSIGILETRDNELKETLDRIHQPLFLDTVARTQLNLKKEGEKVVVVSLSPEDSLSSQQSSSSNNGSTDSYGVEARNPPGETGVHGWFFNVITWWEFFFDNT